MDNLFDRKYSVELSKLRFGLNEEDFKIDSSFFSEFEFSQIQEGDLAVKAEITKYIAHLDVTLQFEGNIILHCDRCMAPYPYELKFTQRVIFTSDQEMEFDHDEVVIMEDGDVWLDLHGDFFDFIHLQIPIRKVPPPELHLCPPKVLEILGLDAQGNEILEAKEEKDEVIDPRWAALKKLKDKE
ncbi:MAG: DUF177 domain-containing protein [Bacteroidota bacterium]